jgi:hypothetical protein
MGMPDHAIFWFFPALVAFSIVLQLRYGCIPLGWIPGKWQGVEKAEDEGRFWLYIVAQCLLVLILIGQALSK